MECKEIGFWPSMSTLKVLLHEYLAYFAVSLVNLG